MSEPAQTELTRRMMRTYTFQILYAYYAFEGAASLESIIDNINRDPDAEVQIPLDGEVFKTAQMIIDDGPELDIFIQPLLANWRLDRIGFCTRLILHMGVWELKYLPTPVQVVINECVELAKCFLEDDAYRFINGVLDEAAKRLDRPVEPYESVE